MARILCERPSHLKVGKTHGRNDVLSFQIERSSEGFATEGHRRTLLECEEFLDDVLYGHDVCTMVDEECAVDIESTLVEVRPTDVAIASKRDLVASILVHEYAQVKVLIDVGIHIYMYVSRRFRLKFRH